MRLQFKVGANISITAHFSHTVTYLKIKIIIFFGFLDFPRFGREMEACFTLVFFVFLVVFFFNF